MTNVVPIRRAATPDELHAELAVFIQLVIERRRARWHNVPWQQFVRLAEKAGIDVPEELR